MNNNFFTPRRILMGVAIIAVILLLWKYCGNTPAPRTDQLMIRLDAHPATLNPLFARTGTSTQVCSQVFQTLGNLDPQTLEMKPLLITQIPTVQEVKDGTYAGTLMYEFEIIPEAVWDNGSPVTANDVLFTLKIIFHPLVPNPYRSFLEYLKAVEIDPANPKKFKAYFSRYYFLSLETLCQTPIYPAYNYDPSNHLTNIPLADMIDTAKVKAFASDPGAKAFAEEIQLPKFVNDKAAISGSGAYRMESMNDEGAILVKKENWWGDKLVPKYPLLAAYPQRLIYKVFSNENIMESKLKNGELDLAGGSISAGKFLEMKQNDSLAARFDFFALGTTQYNRWLFNVRNAKLKDVRVRRALAHVVDFDYLINTVQQGLASRTVGPISASKPYYAKDIVLHDFNIQTAKTLLAEAGWKDSNGNGIADKVMDGKVTELALDLLAPTSSRTNELAAASIKETARQAGVQINVIATDINELSRATRAGQFESAFLGGQLFPGMVELKQTYHSSTSRSGYTNPQLDSVINAIRIEPNDAARNTLYVQAQQILHDEVPEVFLFASLQRIIVAKKFDHVTTSSRPGYYESMFKLKQK